MNKFQGKYRIESARAPFWNYGWNAAYFVTLCTRHRTCFFGDVQNKTMHLSQIGQIAQACWIEIPQHFPFVRLENHVVMPNHVHGIVVIDKPNDGRNREDGGDWRDVVETQNFASLPPPPPPASHHEPSLPGNRFGPQSQNLASIVRGFKIGVTKNARLIDPDFAWQPRFHDHIIRDERAFCRISDYIRNNPARWHNDTFHPHRSGKPGTSKNNP